MKKQNYRLGTVLDVRRQNRNEAAVNLRECQYALELAEADLQHRIRLVEIGKNQLDEAVLQFESTLENGTSISSLVSYKNFIESLKDNLEKLEELENEQKVIVIAAQSSVETAFDELANASKALAVIEKHEKNWSIDEQKRVTREEQKELDETSAILHERNKKL